MAEIYNVSGTEDRGPGDGGPTAGVTRSPSSVVRPRELDRAIRIE